MWFKVISVNSFDFVLSSAILVDVFVIQAQTLLRIWICITWIWQLGIVLIITDCYGVYFWIRWYRSYSSNTHQHIQHSDGTNNLKIENAYKINSFIVLLGPKLRLPHCARRVHVCDATHYIYVLFNLNVRLTLYYIQLTATSSACIFLVALPLCQTFKMLPQVQTWVAKVIQCHFSFCHGRVEIWCWDLNSH